MHAADESAYCDFVAARRRSLLQTAFLFTCDWHAAEDLVQITLAKLYVAWTRVRRRDDVDAYARRTLLNAYLDERRRPWRREQAAAGQSPNMHQRRCGAVVGERAKFTKFLEA